jgi:hypothetical protein
MPDWANERGIANEPNFDRFVGCVGGERIDKKFGAQKNADYIFETHRVLIELKIIETEFGKTESFERKQQALFKSMAGTFGAGAILRGAPGVQSFYSKGVLELYRAPPSRIAKKANLLIFTSS